MKIITMKVKAFSGESSRSYRVSVDHGGNVRVWDDVAGYYTLTHALSQRAQDRARAIAKD